MYRIYAGSGEPAGFSSYVVVQFDRPFRAGATWSGKERQQGSMEHNGIGVVTCHRFAFHDDEQVSRTLDYAFDELRGERYG